MLQKVKNTEEVANRSNAMESGNHSKNGASLKSLMSRRNFKNQLMLLVCLISVSSYGQTWQVGYPAAASVTATFNSGTLTISGTGAMQDWSSGAYVPWNNVSGGYVDFDHITSVIINSGVTSIGNNAFSTAHRISYLSIPSSVTRIGEGTFYNCLSLIQLDIPYGVTTIEKNAFHSCYGLTSINIPTSVSSIGQSAFGAASDSGSSMHLTDVTVNWTNPLSVPPDIFFAVNLANVKLHVPAGTASNYKSASVWKDFGQIIEEGATGETEQTWNIGNPGYNSNVKATLSGGTLTISGSGNMVDFWDSTEGEAPWWFNESVRKAITTIVIQGSVTNIGNRAFKDCSNLQTVSIESPVSIIGRQAFYNCTSTNFTEIKIPNTVLEIEREAFRSCTSLNKVEIEDGSGQLNFTGYRYSSLGEPANVYDWFLNCPNLQTLHLGRNINWSASSSDASPISDIRATLSTLAIGNMVNTIGGSAFADCNLLTQLAPLNPPCVSYIEN